VERKAQSCLQNGVLWSQNQDSGSVERCNQSGDEAIRRNDLLLYSGILVRFLIPRQCDTALLDEAIIKIKSDIERSVETHLPSGCVAEFQRTA
jgi:hypothetical protein